MYILGISAFFHDSSATLIKDGKIIAAADEERFTRQKHDNNFPLKAIEFCLKFAEISINDIDHIAFYEKPLLKFDRVLDQHLINYPRSLKLFIQTTPAWLKDKLRVLAKIKKLKYKGNVLFIPHHLAHAASSFLVSPFEEAAIFTVDGVGEWSTTTLGIGRGNDINLMKHINFPHSIGLFYSTLTAFLGFSVNNSEYKVMGLSVYGNMDRESNEFYKRFKEMIDIKDDGSFRLDMKYFKYDYTDRMPSIAFEKLLGTKVRKAKDPLEDKHKDIAAAGQLITEDVIIKSLNHLYEITKISNVVLAGGVALNSVINGKILSNTPFKQIWIQPHAGDGGTSLGAAYFAYNSILGEPRINAFDCAYLGPQESDEEIKAYLIANKIKHHKFKSREELIKKTVELILKNQVVGWFQGRMEWGPRALGARSILANPCNPEAKELLNTKVKHREHFRPFAPVVLADRAEEFFDIDKPLPEPSDYMLMVYPIKKKWHNKIPSVTHVDGSGRLQTIRREQNDLYYDVIEEFGKRTGIPILINTSFNIRGEPIVAYFKDAYKCMMGTGIDALIAGHYLIYRDENPKDIWDSEAFASD